MNSLITAGLVLSLFLLALVVGKKQKVFADRFLIVYLCFAALRQAYVLTEAVGFFQHSYFMLLGKGFYLVMAPLFFFYVQALTGQRMSRTVQVAVFGLPLAAYILHYFYYFFFVFDEVHLTIHSGLLYINGELSPSWAVFVLLFLIIDPVYLIWFCRLLKSYRSTLLSSVSNTERINLHWLSVLFYLWLASVIIFTPLGVMAVVTNAISLPVIQFLYEGSNVAFLFIFGYYGFRQTTALVNTIPAEELSGGYSRSGLSVSDAKKYHERLLALMNNEKPYLQGELSAGELARLLGISTNHLSQVLTQEQRQNFFDFVNSYRVEAVIDRMKDPASRNVTLLAIALDSGFNSKTSFNTIFKKTTGQTPSQYYKVVAQNQAKSA